MIRRLLGAAGLAMALLGCSEDPTRLSVVDDPTMPSPGRVSGLLAARDEPKKDDKASTASAEAVKQGLEVAQKSDLASAIALFEHAHKLDPKNRQALFFLTLGRELRADQVGAGKEQTALFISAGESARKLRELAGKEAQVPEKRIVGQALYNEARALAKDKQPEKAMASLTEAVDAGYSDDKTMASADELKPLRDRPEFPRLVEKAKEMAKMAIKEQDDKMTAEMLPEVKSEMATFQSFPFSFELPGLDGKPVKLADFKGKVTVVDIWGTWCPPCRMEIPHFIALRDNYKGKGLEIIGINKEKEKGKEKELIEPVAKEMGINYTLVIGDDKVEESVPDFSAYPTTLFIDREGKVRFKHVGYAPYEVLEYIVKTLLDEKPKTP